MLTQFHFHMFLFVVLGPKTLRERSRKPDVKSGKTENSNTYQSYWRVIEFLIVRSLMLWLSFILYERYHVVARREAPPLLSLQEYERYKKAN